MAEVRLENLRKTFSRGSVVAVEGLDLTIDDGEFVTVVGPSGCGKTTTLRMIAGLETPTEGAVYIGEEDVTDDAAKNRPIAMVFQNYALYPHKTVLENMEFGLRMRTSLSTDDRRERVREMAEMLDIEELLEDTPDELSGGQKQRVALGRAIVREPEVFLFDEPLSNLDAKLRTEMRAEIQELQRQFGVTAIYVTHDQEEAMTMGDRIVILNDGSLQQAGKPTEVYNNPTNEFVAGFIGSPSMNFLDVTVNDLQDGVALETEDPECRVDLAPTYGSDIAESLDNEHFRLGVRPENVQLYPDAGEAVAEATVRVVEPVGSDNYIHLDLTDDFIARTAATVEPATGETVPVGFDVEHIHLFHPETGENILIEERETEAVIPRP